jgi:autotransporter translocation and assembly factor TamB
MTKRGTKIALYTTLSIVLAMGGLALFTQTPMFRETVRATLYTFLEKEVKADIYIGEINGSLFTGLTVDTVMMYVDGAPFVESGKLSVKYDLVDFLKNKITID